jgi:hypothetical protein
MAGKTPTQNLQQALEEVQSHLEAGDQRIKAWYSDDFDPPENFPELETAPHQYLIEGGAQLHSFAADLTESSVELGDPANDAELVLYGVGMERLLTGVYLKVDSAEFIQKMVEKGVTPSFRDCKWVLIEELTERLPSEQCGMVVLVLDILWELRNNEAHLGYHSYYPAQVRRLFLEVSCLIQQLFADSEPAELDRIREVIEERRNQRAPAAQTVEFDLSRSP